MTTGRDQIASGLHLGSEIASEVVSELHLNSRLHLQVESGCNLQRCNRIRCDSDRNFLDSLWQGFEMQFKIGFEMQFKIELAIFAIFKK